MHLVSVDEGYYCYVCFSFIASLTTFGIFLHIFCKERPAFYFYIHISYTVKLGNKERFDKEPFQVTNLPYAT